MDSLSPLIMRYGNRSGVAIIFLLGWLASCDGSVDGEELSLLHELGSNLLHDAKATETILPLARRADVDDIILASNVLRLTVEPSRAHMVFELTLAMAMADGVFSVGENHVVRYLADVLGIGARQFALSFQNVTGRPPQPPSDLSSASWWAERDRKESEAAARASEARRARDERARRESNQAGGQSRKEPPPLRQPGETRRTEALRQLGLDPGATDEEIKAAYKRLAKAHHPDRFEGLSVEIVEAASLSFRRIREAYEYLLP